jgi:hypothetical protein
MKHNTSSNNSPQPGTPRYLWPRPGLDDWPRLAWADWLRLWAHEIDRACGGDPGFFLGNWLAALAEQATVLGAHDPSSHFNLAQAEQDRPAAWLRAVEEEVMNPGGVWMLSAQAGPKAEMYVHDGPDGPEPSAVRGWIASDPDDLTFYN